MWGVNKSVTYVGELDPSNQRRGARGAEAQRKTKLEKTIRTESKGSQKGIAYCQELPRTILEII